MKFVERELNLQFRRKVLFTDSEICLHWLNTSKPLSIFLENRIKEIKSLPSLSFRRVLFKENPADLTTKPVGFTETMWNFWLHGPKWLLDTNEASPVFKVNDEQRPVSSVIDSESFTVLACPQYTPIAKNRFEIVIGTYLSLMKLLRVTALCKGAVHNFKAKKPSRIIRGLTANELEAAKVDWIVSIQKQHFSDIIAAIHKGTYKSEAFRFDLKLDKDGIFRQQSRLTRCCVPEVATCPALLPNKNDFTSLVVSEIHTRLCHAGVAHTLSETRKEFWITKGRTTISGILKRCRVCRRHEGGAFRLPQMSDIPFRRINPASPFSHVGLDYFGPMYARNGCETSKVWVCLITCAVTTAVHLELVNSLSAEDFLLAFRKFIVLRRKPKTVTSDNQPTFKVVCSTYEEAVLEILKNQKAQQFSATRGITWLFIVEYSPWMGGFYERLVGLTKRALRKSFGSTKCLTIPQLQTLLYEVQAVLHTRPLLYVSEDVGDHILTPADFLHTASMSTEELQQEPEEPKDPTYIQNLTSAQRLLQSWKRGDRYLNQMWQLWSREYLQSLKERPQRFRLQGRTCSPFKPAVGSVVLIRKPNLPRGRWRIGKGRSGRERKARECR